MKFDMAIDLVDVAAPDPLEELALDEPALGETGRPLLHAARSSAAARTRTTAPPLNRRAGSRTTQTACDVGLKANGVPDEVCAPGYIPST